MDENTPDSNAEPQLSVNGQSITTRKKLLPKSLLIIILALVIVIGGGIILLLFSGKLSTPKNKSQFQQMANIPTPTNNPIVNYSNPKESYELKYSSDKFIPVACARWTVIARKPEKGIENSPSWKAMACQGDSRQNITITAYPSPYQTPKVNAGIQLNEKEVVINGIQVKISEGKLSTKKISLLPKWYLKAVITGPSQTYVLYTENPQESETLNQILVTFKI